VTDVRDVHAEAERPGTKNCGSRLADNDNNNDDEEEDIAWNTREEQLSRVIDGTFAPRRVRSA